MQGEESLRWTAFIGASVLVHAAVLAWVDLSGAEIGRLPTTLKVLLESRGDKETSVVANVPASATRNRHLFDRPPVRVTKAPPVEPVEKQPDPVEKAPAPEPVAAMETKKPERAVEAMKMPGALEPLEMREETVPTASTPPAIDSLEPASLKEVTREPADPAESDGAVAHVAAAESAPPPDGSSADAGKHRGELLSLLHHAISREKRYPLLAVRQRREGTATVSFSLSPSGEMDAIGIDRSSGFSVLDTAAVSAVSRVAPFAPARLFLSDVTRFKVDVTFRLN